MQGDTLLPTAAPGTALDFDNKGDDAAPMADFGPQDDGSGNVELDDENGQPIDPVSQFLTVWVLRWEPVVTALERLWALESDAARAFAGQPDIPPTAAAAAVAQLLVQQQQQPPANGVGGGGSAVRLLPDRISALLTTHTVSRWALLFVGLRQVQMLMRTAPPQAGVAQHQWGRVARSTEAGGTAAGAVAGVGAGAHMGRLPLPGELMSTLLGASVALVAQALCGAGGPQPPPPPPQAAAVAVAAAAVAAAAPLAPAQPVATPKAGGLSLPATLQAQLPRGQQPQQPTATQLWPHWQQEQGHRVTAVRAPDYACDPVTGSSTMPAPSPAPLADALAAASAASAAAMDAAGVHPHASAAAGGIVPLPAHPEWAPPVAAAAAPPLVAVPPTPMVEKSEAAVADIPAYCSVSSITDTADSAIADALCHLRIDALPTRTSMVAGTPDEESPLHGDVLGAAASAAGAGGAVLSAQTADTPVFGEASAAEETRARLAEPPATPLAPAIEASASHATPPAVAELLVRTSADMPVYGAAPASVTATSAVTPVCGEASAAACTPVKVTFDAPPVASATPAAPAAEASPTRSAVHAEPLAATPLVPAAVSGGAALLASAYRMLKEQEERDRASTASSAGAARAAADTTSASGSAPAWPGNPAGAY